MCGGGRSAVSQESVPQPPQFEEKDEMKRISTLKTNKQTKQNKTKTGQELCESRGGRPGLPYSF